ALIQNFSAEDVRRHQVRRELDAFGIEAKRDAQRFDQLGLGKAGHADQQRMTAGEDGHERVLHHLLLTEDHGGYRLFRRADLTRDLFRRADDHVLELFHTVGHSFAPYFGPPGATQLP